MARHFRYPAAGGRPVVLLLGWLGSKERYLNRYIKMWQNLGAQVIAHQPSILQTAVPSLADRQLLNLMKDFTYSYSALCTLRGETPPVLVHAMSNAGFIAYGSILHLVGLLRGARPPGALTPAPGLSPPALEFNPAAWPAGSGGMTARPLPGPGARPFRLWGGTAGSGGEAAQQRLGPGGGEGLHPFVTDPPSLAVLSAFRQVLHNTEGIVVDSAVLAQPAHVVEESHPLLLRTAQRLAERYFLLPQVVQRMREVRYAWQYQVPPCPQLYLYSRADTLIPYQHIEHFMDQQAAHGVPVHHHCWDDSSHCEHYRKHPEQYRSLVHSFTETCLHGHTPPETWI